MIDKTADMKRKLFVLTILSLSICTTKGAINEKPYPYLASCGLGQVILLTEQYGTVNFSGKDFNKVNNCQHWDIVGPLYSTITISIQSFLNGNQPGEACGSRSFLLIGPDPLQMLCTVEPDSQQRVYRSRGHMVWIEVFTKDNQSSFQLDYIMNGTSNCSGIHCQDLSCILPQWRCNGIFECLDQSDEEACYKTASPKSAPNQKVDEPNGLYFTNSKPLVSPPSGVVEPLCGFGEIWCYVVKFRKKMCLHNIYKCNQVQDCLYGEDERSSICGADRCNQQLGDSYGWFTSPNYPQLYPPNSVCSWVIHQTGSSPASTIQLRITTFNLEDEPATDYVKIFDGPDTTYPLLRTLYGAHDSQSIIESTSNWMKVIFYSNKYDEFRGFNITYQFKGVCLPEQLACLGETDCFYPGGRCDGVWDCVQTGFDETGCDHCNKGDYSCGIDTDQCYHPSDRCNGIARCANKADESNCSSAMCSNQNGTFLCDNKRCIYEKWTCDQRDDCGDSSDEKFCEGNTRRVIIAAIGGSMICLLLLVILLGCSCKLYSLRHVDRSRSSRHETPMSRLYAELLRRRAPPPYHEAMLTSRNFDEVQQEYLQHLQSRQRISRGSWSRRSRRSRNARGGGANDSESRSDVEVAETAGQSDANVRTSVGGVAILPTMTEENENINNEFIVRQSSRDPLLHNDSETDTTDVEYETEEHESRGQYHDQGQGRNRSVGNEREIDGEDDDEEEDDDDDDDENILESRLLSSQWARATAADDSSDDVCILENELDDGSRSVAMEMTSDLVRNHCDNESVETASASLDSVDILDIQSTQQQDRGGKTSDADESDSSGGKDEEDENDFDSRSSSPKPENFFGNELIHIPEASQGGPIEDSVVPGEPEMAMDSVPLNTVHSCT